MVRRNFRKVELPTTYLGVRPSLMSDPVTNGPQPPPAKESKKPPKSPKNGILLLLRLIFSVIFLCPNSVLTKILTPINKVYTESIGFIIRPYSLSIKYKEKDPTNAPKIAYGARAFTNLKLIFLNL